MAKKTKAKAEEPYGLRLARHRNEEMAKGMRDIAFGNKAGSHDARPNRLRTRSSVKRAALNDYR